MSFASLPKRTYKTTGLYIGDFPDWSTQAARERAKQISEKSIKTSVPAPPAIAAVRLLVALDCGAEPPNERLVLWVNRT